MKALNYKIGDYVFNPNNKTLTYNDIVIKLVDRKVGIIQLLCCGEMVNTSTILEKVFGEDTYYNARNLAVYLTHLRKDFINDKNIEIVNVHGVGFKLNGGITALGCEVPKNILLDNLLQLKENNVIDSVLFAELCEKVINKN